MSIELPEFGDSFLEALTICAVVEEVKGPEDPKTLESRIDSEVPIWVRTISNQQHKPEGAHIHLDAVRESRLKDLPINPAAIEDTLSHFDDYFGHEVFALIRARFVIPFDEVTNMVSLFPFFDPAQESDPSIRLTGVTFSLKNQMIDEIEWKLLERDGQEYVGAQFEGSTDLELQPDFLIEILSPMSELFQYFTKESSDSKADR